MLSRSRVDLSNPILVARSNRSNLCMADALQPKFPHDIERLIFGLALRNNFQNIQNLLGVARRIDEW